jgi:uncharacterized membrane protein SpoIIM required for sporulation
MALTPLVPEAAFTARRLADWERLDAIVRRAQRGGVRALPAGDVALLSPSYLDACADLSRARAARYGAPLIAYLEGLCAAAHAVLYGSRSRTRLGAGRPVRVALAEALDVFPRAVRRHRIAVLVAFVLFFFPFAWGLASAMHRAEFAVRVVPEAMLRPLVDAYREGFDEERGMGIDAAMAGFYVQHNVGIALRCFATGLALGFGSAFYLAYNGMTTGAVLGYVAAKGAGANILTFVVGHGSLELGAIVLAGGAGLALGWSIVAPGERTRLASLQAAARSVTPIVFGASAMLFLAATVEGFWSASTAPAIVKRAAGGLIFLLVVSYLGLAGRGRRDAGGGQKWT